MEKIKLAVFDMAGTTINEDNLVYRTLQKAIGLHGYEVSLEQVLLHGAGKEKHQAIKDVLQALGMEKRDSEKIFKTFKVLLSSVYQDHEVCAFEGVEDVLITLKAHRIKVVLNTGYDRPTAQLLLDKLGWKQGDHFDFCVTAKEVKNARPAPDMIQMAMELTGVRDPSYVLKAGDSIIDIEEGRNAQCGLVIGVTTGAHTIEQLRSAKPDYILDSLKELQNFLDLT